MDMQNVSNLVIPEGEVRTIHDKNSRLLWGKLSYDTKYAGNTIQDGTPTPDAPVAIQTVTGAQTVTITGKNLFSSPVIVGGWNANGTANMGASAKNRFKSQDKIAVSPSTTYTLSGDPKISGKTLQSTVQTYNASETIISQLPSSSTFATLPYTFTTPSSCHFITISGRYSDNTQIGSTLGEPTDAILHVQLEQGGSRTSYEVYEKATYTVNLGSTELCRIGNYQDYIYKNGDDWYVHKEIGKYTFTGAENWQTESYGTNSWKVGGIIAIYEHNVTEVETLCDYAQGVSYNGRAQGDATNTCVCYVNQNDVFIVRNTTITTKVAMQAATTGKDLYYKATPIDTKITDNTLISQLNTVHQFLTRYGYNSIVSGNLPLIISKTNL